MAEYKHYIEKINNEICDSPVDYISKCEHRYTSVLRQNASEVVNKEGKNKIIMLSGPSSSGKTTSATKMARLISRMSHNAYVISLDDFYKNRTDIPFGPDGKQDFETVHALALDILTDCLFNLSNKGEAMLPQFDFNDGVRTDNVMKLCLEPGDVVIVEGLHALNPIITDCLPADSLTKMYVSTASDIYNEEGEVFLNKREIRFLRRMIRDYNFRGSSVENTYNMWPKVVSGEIEYLIPYIPTADYILDSVHAYEICVYKDKAIELLKELPSSHENYSDSLVLIDKLQGITGISKNLMPKSSLLREFVGK